MGPTSLFAPLRRTEMSQGRSRFAHTILPLVTVLALGSCADDTEAGRYELPLSLHPVRLQGASEADSAAAWALFDRDTGTRWSAETGELGIVLDAPRTLSYLKVFGPASGMLELRSSNGLLATVNLSTLRTGWNRVSLA